MTKITKTKLARARVVEKVLIIKGEKKFRRSITGYEPPLKRSPVVSPNTGKTHYCNPGQIIWFGKGRKRK